MYQDTRTEEPGKDKALELLRTLPTTDLALVRATLPLTQELSHLPFFIQTGCVLKFKLKIFMYQMY